MKSSEIRNEIRQSLDEIKVVNTHDHCASHLHTTLENEIDLPYFLTHTYLGGDFVASGLTHGEFAEEKFDYLRSQKSPDRSEELWGIIKDALNNVGSTIYFRYLLIALRDLYGLEEDELNDDNWRGVSDRIREASRDSLNWVKRLMNRMNLRKMILDNNPKPASLDGDVMADERLVQVVRMDGFIHEDRGLAQIMAGKRVYSFDAYLDSLDKAFEKAVKAGAVGVKSGLAYNRILRYDEVTRPDAERIFDRGLLHATIEDKKAFQDFMMHQVCQRCEEYDLPFQIHTGLQAGNYNTITNANPTHLTNLFQKYSGVRFDIFHGGYPYYEEAGLMAKYFPNVYIDGCWFAHFSPQAYKRALHTWIEMVPANKIFAWGGDHRILDHSYASLMLAKDLISEVLADKVSNGYFGGDRALQVAKKILSDNAAEVYGF